VMSTNDKEIKQGDAVIFSVSGKTICGVFMGINAKTGVWEFNGLGQFAQMEFSVHPKSIDELYPIKSIEMEK